VVHHAASVAPNRRQPPNHQTAATNRARNPASRIAPNGPRVRFEPHKSGEGYMGCRNAARLETDGLNRPQNAIEQLDASR
jgi:hypothetical protein